MSASLLARAAIDARAAAGQTGSSRPSNNRRRSILLTGVVAAAAVVSFSGAKTAFAGMQGGVANGACHLLEGWRSRRDIQSAIPRNIQKIDPRKIVVQRKIRDGLATPPPFASEKFNKEQDKIKELMRRDLKFDQELGLRRNTPAAGEYVMPVSEARNVLEAIYGNGPHAKEFAKGNDLESKDDDILKGRAKSRVDWMRRQAGDEAAPRVRVGDLPGRIRGRGLKNFVASLPRQLSTDDAVLGIRGGSVDDSMHEFFISGATVSHGSAGDNLFDG